MPTLESGAIAAITKYGWLKLATLGSALGGALLMAVFRPPTTRKEVLMHALVALGCSFYFGDTVYTFINKYVEMDIVASHGLVGAMSWGLFGGLATLRDRFFKDPVQVAKDVKDII